MLTSRQSVCLEILRYFISERKRCPTYSELALMLGTGKGPSHRLVMQLIERGYVARVRGAKGYEIHPSRASVFETFTFDDTTRTLQPTGLRYIAEMPANPNSNGYFAGETPADAMLK